MVKGDATMSVSELISKRLVFSGLRAQSKKALFQEISQRVAGEIGADPRDLFAALLEREHLGSTGMGRGVAIPHCRLPSLGSIHVALARLDAPIDFDAVDNEPVDLFFFLIAPESAGSDHLRALARLSRALRDPAFQHRLRGAASHEALVATLSDIERPCAA